MPAFLSDSIVRGLSGDFQKTPVSQTSAVGADLPTLGRSANEQDCPPLQGLPAPRHNPALGVGVGFGPYLMVNATLDFTRALTFAQIFNFLQMARALSILAAPDNQPITFNGATSARRLDGST
jgi:hypothetical protein